MKDGCAIAPTLQMPDLDNCLHTNRAPQLHAQDKHYGPAVSRPGTRSKKGGWELNSPVAHSHILDILRLPVPCSHALDPPRRHRLRSRQMLIRPRREIKARIVQWRVGMFSNRILRNNQKCKSFRR